MILTDHAGVPVPRTFTDEELTAIYKRANGEDVGKAKSLTTQRVFRAMRATAAGVPAGVAIPGKDQP